jgi:hypothetical protein
MLHNLVDNSILGFERVDTTSESLEELNAVNSITCYREIFMKGKIKPCDKLYYYLKKFTQ